MAVDIRRAARAVTVGKISEVSTSWVLGEIVTLRRIRKKLGRVEGLEEWECCTYFLNLS